MSQFFVYDEEGKGIQSNKVFEAEGYGDLLASHDMKFIMTDSSEPLGLSDWWVNKGELLERPEFPIMQSKTVIKAGDQDSSLFTNVPKDCRVTIIAAGSAIYNDILDATELEIAIPVPCIYKVTFEKFPYKPKAFTIEAIP